MKFLCPACERLADIAGFRLDAGALLLRCGKCGVEGREASPPSAPPAAAALPGLSASGRVEAPPSPGAPAPLVFLRAVGPGGPVAPAREDPFTVPEGFCPKCVARRRPGVKACPSCGLLFANFRPADQEVAPEVASAWRELLDAWQDDLAHDRFLRLALADGQMVAAARLYRIQLAQHPDDPFAARGRDEVVRLASAAASALAPAGGKGPSPSRRWQVAAVAAIGFAVLVLIVTMARRLAAMLP